MKYIFYSDLAKYYDKIYHYVDYEKQTKFFVKLLGKSMAHGNKILDLACGTGRHASLLSNEGFDIIGVDSSSSMLSVARKNYPALKFYRGDMKTWKSKTKFTAIIIFFNSILYNKTKNELRTTLKNCFNQLLKKGLLIFDTVDKSIGISSKDAVIKYSAHNLNISFSPKWVYSPRNKFMDLEIDFTINGKKLHDHHTMGAFSLEEQKQLAEEAGFDVSMLERSFDKMKKITRKDKKAIFLCQKI